MYGLEQKTVNEHLPLATQLLRVRGVDRASRNGPVRVIPGPFCVTTLKPEIRTLLCPARKNNPFVDFFDGLFILSGTRNLGFLTNLHSRFIDYTEYDSRAHGQYSHRILKHFGFNQLLHAAEELNYIPYSRRAVIQLWDPAADHHRVLQDVPCNISCTPFVDFEGSVSLTVFNRSNDIYWGMLGVNIVQFSFLLEILAFLIGRPVGQMHQITNNGHAYLDFGPYTKLAEGEIECLPWSDTATVPLIIPDPTANFSERVRTINDWMRQLNLCWEAKNFSSLKHSGFVFLREVVFPMSIAAYSGQFDPNYILDYNWRKAVEIYNDYR